MTVFLRVVCCLLVLIFATTAHAQTSPLAASEHELLEAYNKAVGILTAQKPSLLMALQKEQDTWREFRDNECKQATSFEYCKANMNRKRTHVLMGEHPSGKKQGTSF